MRQTALHPQAALAGGPQTAESKGTLLPPCQVETLAGTSAKDDFANTCAALARLQHLLFHAEQRGELEVPLSSVQEALGEFAVGTEQADTKSATQERSAKGTLVTPCSVVSMGELSEVARSIGHSVAAYKVLGDFADDFQTGGCWAFAEALHRCLPGSTLKALASNLNRVEHVVVEFKGWLFDSDGGCDPFQKTNKFTKEFGRPVKIVPFSPRDVDPTDMVANPALEADLEALFRKALEAKPMLLEALGEVANTLQKSLNTLSGGEQGRPGVSSAFIRDGGRND